MKSRISIILVFLFLVLPMVAQERSIVHYGEAEGLSYRHVTQILQDHYGFIWLSTWNGLSRFDGRDFVTFKSHPGDGVSMPSDRIRNIAINDRNPDILNCLVDNEWFYFSIISGKFTELGKTESKALDINPGHGNGIFNHGDGSIRFVFRDRQRLTWLIGYDGIDLSIPSEHVLKTIARQQSAEVKSITPIGNHVWVTSKDDNMVRIYSNGSSVPSYLSPDGSISKSPVAFPSPVYCVRQTRNHGILLGCKHGGMYMLKARGDRFDVVHISKRRNGLPANDIYDIVEDSYGRLWLATMDAGVVCYDGKNYHSIAFGRENKARRLLLCGSGILSAATTEGFLVLDINPNHKLSWHLHRREANRETSLSNNACMDLAEIDGQYYIATESGGINEVKGSDLLSPNLSFRHFDERTGLGSDVILSLLPYTYYINGKKRTYLIAVSSRSLLLINPRTGESRELGEGVLGQSVSFSEARPYCDRKGNIWLGLNDGLSVARSNSFVQDNADFPIVLTSVTIENAQTDYTVNQLDTITLTQDERTVAINFAVLDYRNPHSIRYAYRVNGDADWHYLGNNNSLTLSELSPGEYDLELRATDAMGQWNTHTRHIRIIVTPKFVETIWFQLILLLLSIGILVAILLTRRYIIRIKAEQKSTLKAYLDLLEQHQNVVSPDIQPIESPKRKLSHDDEQFMSRIMDYVKSHISDSDAGVDDMASFAAVSRSGLNRKLKSIVGLTPADFLREARIKHACQMLRNSDLSVSDIAYECGFTDPRYFSRIFRQSKGVSPSEYRVKIQH